MISIRLLLFLALVAGAARGAEPNAEDVELAFWQVRATRDPEDATPAIRMGFLLLLANQERGGPERLQQAEAHFRKALSLEKKNTGALAGLAAALSARHRFAEALPIAEQAVALAPADGQALGILGDIQFHIGLVDDSEKTCARLHELRPGAGSRARLAAISHLRGKTDKAIELLRDALEDAEALTASTTTWLRIQLAALLLNSGQREEAEKLLLDAIAASPRSAPALERLADLRGSQDRFDEALEFFRAAHAVSPSAHLMESMAVIHARAGRLNEAHKLYDEALNSYLKSVEEGDPHSYRHLALHYAESDPSNPGQAVLYAEKDLTIRQDIWTYEVLGWAYYKAGRLKDAAAAMDKALALGTREGRLLYRAGMVYARNGDFARGKTLIREAFEINPYFHKLHGH